MHVSSYGKRVVYLSLLKRYAHAIILPEAEKVANLKQYNDTVGLHGPWRLADSGWRLGRRMVAVG